MTQPPHHRAVTDGVDPRPAPPNGDLPVDDRDSVFAELQQLLLTTAGLTSFLTEVAILAAAVVPGASCGVTMRPRPDQTYTVASSDSYALDVDEIQYGTGQGPCLEAMHTNTEIIVADLIDDARWGNYRIHAISRGVRSSLSIPLVHTNAPIGVINLYHRQPAAFTPTAAASIRAFARQASTAVLLALRHAESTNLQDQLRDALHSRSIIDQAIGLLIGQRRITAPHAFEVLRTASQGRNVKVSDIATEIITAFTGHPPQPPRPFTNPR